MKGTLAILGLLVAAYAAPLFANEVPLILEETIQMPEAGALWDVAPIWGEPYVWSLTKWNGDSIWSYWGSNGADSTHQIRLYLADSSSAEDYETISNVKSAFLLIVDGLPAIFLETSLYIIIPSYGSGVDGFRVYRLLDGTRLQTCNWSRYGVYGYEYYNFRTFATEAIGVPPNQYQTCRFGLKYTVDPWWGNPPYSAFALGWSLQLGCDTTNCSGFAKVSGSSWADVDLFGYISWTYNTNRRTVCHGFFNGSKVDRNVYTLVLPDDTTIADYDEMYSVAYSVPVAALLTGHGSLLLCYPDEESARFELDHDYIMILPGYALIGEASEQVLALRDDNSFDLVMLETGQVWGQTSPLDSGYAKMKIIGRYHNETRRLVVRYGSELRIYRFGEPIYTDADDTRPKLPQELALSAYPNPFNPTTMIAFDLPKAARASLSVYDLNGRLVQTLFDEPRTARHSKVAFNGANLPSGIYFARLVAGDFARTQKLVLLK